MSNVSYDFAFRKFWNNTIPKIVIKLKRWFSGLINIKGLPWANAIASANPFIWLGDLVFLTLDMIMIPEIYELIKTLILKNRLRQLNEEEEKIAEMVFGDNLDISSILINTRMVKGMEKLCTAYVSFNCINFTSCIRDKILVHELVHVYQYQRHGSLYLFRAILAQLRKDTYDYGGLHRLSQLMTLGKGIFMYNFEQQAEIIEDYYFYSFENQELGAYGLSVYRYFYQDFLENNG